MQSLCLFVVVCADLCGLMKQNLRKYFQKFEIETNETFGTKIFVCANWHNQLGGVLHVWISIATVL